MGHGCVVNEFFCRGQDSASWGFEISGLRSQRNGGPATVLLLGKDLVLEFLFLCNDYVAGMLGCGVSARRIASRKNETKGQTNYTYSGERERECNVPFKWRVSGVFADRMRTVVLLFISGSLLSRCEPCLWGSLSCTCGMLHIITLIMAFQLLIPWSW